MKSGKTVENDSLIQQQIRDDPVSAAMTVYQRLNDRNIRLSDAEAYLVAIEKRHPLTAETGLLDEVRSTVLLCDIMETPPRNLKRGDNRCVMLGEILKNSNAIDMIAEHLSYQKRTGVADWKEYTDVGFNVLGYLNESYPWIGDKMEAIARMGNDNLAVAEQERKMNQNWHDENNIGECAFTLQNMLSSWRSPSEAANQCMNLIRRAATRFPSSVPIQYVFTDAIYSKAFYVDNQSGFGVSVSEQQRVIREIEDVYTRMPCDAIAYNLARSLIFSANALFHEQRFEEMKPIYEKMRNIRRRHPDSERLNFTALFSEDLTLGLEKFS